MEQEFIETLEGSDYRFRNQGGSAVVTRCVAKDAVVSVPARLAGYPVVAIEDECFASSRRGDLSLSVANAQLERVDLPEGVARIGRAAFRGCSRLVRVSLPDTLEQIDDLAFSCTSIASIRLPQSCTRLSQLALRTGPESLTGADSPYLSKLDSIEVAEGNPEYRAIGGMLCKRLEDASLEAVLCPGMADELYVSEEVSRIAPAAFAGTYQVGRLRFHDSVEFVDGCGIAVNATCREVEIRTKENGNRATTVKLVMPSSAAQRDVFASTKGSAAFDLESFLEAYDHAVLREPDRLLQSKLMLSRLAHPACLGVEASEHFRAAVERDFEALVVRYGARNYWQGFEDMVDAGVLDDDSLARAVGLLTARADATAVAWLLDLKRARFSGDRWDYGL